MTKEMFKEQQIVDDWFATRLFIKTSDNILDLVEVGDLVDSGDGIVEFLGTFKDDLWIVSMNEIVKKRTVKAIYKRQTNGDYKRYGVE